jgi:hypothetical protein
MKNKITLKRNGMNTSVDIQEIKALDVRIEAERFYVSLEDGREVGVPYEWYWRLANASEAQLKEWRFISGGYGIHWEELDEDISILGILMGKKNPTPPSPTRTQ